MALLQLPQGAMRPTLLTGTAPLGRPGITAAVACSPAFSPASPMPVAISPTQHAGACRTVLSPMAPSAPARSQAAPPLQPQGPWVAPAAAVDPRARELWRRIDSEGQGSISAADFAAAVERDPEAAAFASRCGARASGSGRDAGRAFAAMAEGKERADFGDFEAQHRLAATIDRLPLPDAPRSSKRVFIISAGFGRLLRPAQSQLLEKAGYQIHWCTKPPNPETPNFQMGPHLQQIKSEIDEFKPDVVVCASKGGAYVVQLWETGLWLGATLMINFHPTCKRLPRGVPVVIAAGGDDEHYPAARGPLYQIMSTGTKSHSFLYYAAGSGPRLPPGFAHRMGDRHNMDTLLQNDCLPRLIDAALCPEGPEVHMTRTQAGLLAEGRLEAEGSLRQQLLQRLAGAESRGADRPLSPVEPGSQEFGWVAAAFGSQPKAASAYRFPSQVPFESARIAAVHRVEPGPAASSAGLRRLAELKGSLEDQGVPFEAHVHERWAFYNGCGAQAVSSGMQPQPLGAGPWGNGVYFARDAKYVVDSGTCRGADGSRTVLMCLLASGMPCVGDATRVGELPRRKGAAGYNCAVDSLSSPELYVVPDAGSALAAYLITLA